jgi:putative ABC transport system ATP-binding protein
MISLEKVSKSFRDSTTEITILEEINLEIAQGEQVAIIGSSGAGKTTLLSIMAGLDNPSSGKIMINNQRIDNQSEKDLSQFRNQKIGFVFQSFELINSFTVLENVHLPLFIRGEKKLAQAEAALEKVNLSSKAKSYPGQLSGGEKQRVAIARALVGDPEIIFADEPTGNLDETNTEIITKILTQNAQDHNHTLIMITHDRVVYEQLPKIYELKERKLHAIPRR